MCNKAQNVIRNGEKRAMVYYKHPDNRRDSVITIRLKNDQRQALDALATAAGMSISDLIRQWIDDATKRIARKRRGKK